MLSPMQVKEQIVGPIPGLPVLFDKNGQINHAGIRDHVNFLFENGLKIVLLSIGISEYVHLEEAEVRQIIETVIGAADGRGLVIAETGPWWTGKSVEFARWAQDAGLEALLIKIPETEYLPYDPSVHDDAIVAHFEAISKATSIGLLAHEKVIMSRGTIRPWSLDLIKRISAIDNMIGMKEESWDAGYALEILHAVGDQVAIIDDLGKTSFIFTHSQGSPAYVTGVGQFAPQVSLAFWNAMQSNDLVEARRIALDIAFPIDQMMVKMGWVAFIKVAMELCGLPGGGLRSPGVSLTAEQISQVRDLLDRLELLKH